MDSWIIGDECWSGVPIEFTVESSVSAVEARGHLENPEEGERPPMEDDTRGLVKEHQSENIQCVL
jgi:hypothetical protein